MDNLGRILKHIRKFNHLTQKELGWKLKISRSYVSEMESGNKIPSLEILNKYSETFDLPLYGILLFADNWEERKSLLGKLSRHLTKSALSFLDWICKK